MSRRNNTLPAAVAKPGQAPGPTRRVWWLLGLSAMIFALGSCGFFAWRQHTFAMPVQAGLPVRPALTGKPAQLGEALAKAETRTRSANTMLDGIGELGRLYHANNFYREAEACWQLLRAEQPREARWCYYLADLRRSASDYPAMTALLEETLKLAPDYATAHLQLANLQFKSGEFDSAERHYKLRLAQLPHDPYARLGLVRLALQKGRKDEARTLLELMLKDTPNFSTAHNLYAEILADAGDAAGASQQRWLGTETLRYREAEDPWLDELHAWCYDYDRLCVLGTIEFQTENLDQAHVFIERAIQLKPGEPQAYELLSMLYLKRNDAAKARDLLEQALPRLTTGKPPVLFVNLCRAYRMLKQPAEAIRVARHGLAQAGDSPELIDALGLALADSDRHEEAVEAYHAALARNPNDASTNFNLAVSLLALRRLDDVLAALDRSLTLQPTYPPTLLLRGRIEMEAGHWDLVERYLRPVVESHPENIQARQSLAEWHLHMGAAAESKNDSATAERHYRDGLTIDSNNAELLVSLGVFYLVQARFSEAIGPLGSYRRLQPDNTSGCIFLGQAYAALGRRDDAREMFAEGARLAERSGNTKAATYCREMLQQL